MTTIRTLRLAYPWLFYPQTWLDGEKFMDSPAQDEPCPPPTGIAWAGCVPKDGKGLPRAVDLVQAFVAHPDDGIWGYRMWTSDTDHLGQRVYVCANAEGKLEIHRHLHITKMFGVPTWVRGAA